jgi:glutamyl-Q tRNA(Asp) synthetase
VYEAYLDQLTGEGLLFTCVCTRLSLGKLGQCETDCASRTHSEGSLRFNVPSDAPQSIDDLVLGQQTASELPNNFVVKRKDGAISYQLATAVDDLDEGYTHIIRGADLLESSFRQKAIQQVLKRPSPQYGHVPVLTDSEGYKLSKQSGAQGIDVRRPVQNLRDALSFLRQPTPPEPVEHIADVLKFAQEHWDTSALSTVSCNFLPR